MHQTGPLREALLGGSAQGQWMSETGPMDAPDLLWGLLSLPGQWRRLSAAPRL